MATLWTNPTIISQYAEAGGEDHHISWIDRDGFSDLRSKNGQFVCTNGLLEHIARSPKPDLVNKTYYIKMSGYNFQNLPEVISGIELRLSAKRSGRITDDTVQLHYDDQQIGDNQASLNLNPVKLYGGENILWGLTSVDATIIQDQSFGVLLRFKSHPSWPHKSPVELDSVELRIH
jgi:hypothetical protein